MSEEDLRGVRASPAPRFLLVGGPDVDACLDLMHSLDDAFMVCAAGSLPSIHDEFEAEIFG